MHLIYLLVHPLPAAVSFPISLFEDVLIDFDGWRPRPRPPRRSWKRATMQCLLELRRSMISVTAKDATLER
jgi:hypothetical protein